MSSAWESLKKKQREANEKLDNRSNEWKAGAATLLFGLMAALTVINDASQTYDAPSGAETLVSVAFDGLIAGLVVYHRDLWRLIKGKGCKQTDGTADS